MNQQEGALFKIMQGRDERACLQKSLFSFSDVKILAQISLNIPGCPKRLDNDLDALAEAEKLFSLQCGVNPVLRVSILNSAGAALLMGYADFEATEAKRHGIAVEGSAVWGRMLDIDILTPDGAVSREIFGLPPRICIICEKEAKVCAREGNHSISELRERAAALLSKV